MNTSADYIRSLFRNNEVNLYNLQIINNWLNLSDTISYVYKIKNKPISLILLEKCKNNKIIIHYIYTLNVYKNKGNASKLLNFIINKYDNYVLIAHTINNISKKLFLNKNFKIIKSYNNDNNLMIYYPDKYE